MVRFGELVEARFVRRLNRFAALMEVAGEEKMVHVANSGRMRELLVEGRRMLLKPAPGDHRKTAFDLALVDLGRTLASADARLPNRLVHEALMGGRLPQFLGYDQVFPETTYGDSRLDLALKGAQGTCFVEAKSVTLVVDGVGLFPDASTTRGRKHVESLLDAVISGHRGAAVFVVQRDDAEALAPNDPADPEFGVALRKAVAGGVEVYAYRCAVSMEGITLADPLPVRL